jgi:uncharacterized protein YlaI
MNVTTSEETIRRRLQAKREFIQKFICPDCGSDLQFVPAKKMYSGHKDFHLARSCTNKECEFICFIGDAKPN